MRRTPLFRGKKEICILSFVVAAVLLVTGCGGGGGGGSAPAPAAAPATPATEPAPVALNAPTGVTVSSMSVTWGRSQASDFASYKLYRATNSGSYDSTALIATIVSAATTTYAMSDLAVNTTYFYVVFVCNTSGLCAVSNEVSATTPDGTHTSGTISSDLTLFKAGSPYVLDGSLVVPAGVTLTVEAGTKIMFGGAHSIQVSGAIAAVGTAAEPITFTTATGRNSGATILRFISANLSNTTISYATIDMGARGIQVDYGCTGILTISNSTISNNTSTGNGGGVYNGNSAVTLSNVTVSGNTADAGGGLYTMAGTISVTGSTFSNNSAVYGGGLFNQGGSVVVNESEFTGNEAGFGAGIYSRSSTTVLNTRFEDNTAATAGAGIYTTGWSTLTVTRGIFDGNEAAYGGDGIYHYQSRIDVAYSTFTSTTGRGTAITQFSTPANSPSVTYCDISGFDIGVTGNPVSFHHNNLDNETHNLKLVESTAVTASSNWWGTTDTTGIEAKIFDAADSASLGAVTYSSPLSSAETTAGASQ